MRIGNVSWLLLHAWTMPRSTRRGSPKGPSLNLARSALHAILRCQTVMMFHKEGLQKQLSCSPNWESPIRISLLVCQIPDEWLRVERGDQGLYTVQGTGCPKGLSFSPQQICRPYGRDDEPSCSSNNGSPDRISFSCCEEWTRKESEDSPGSPRVPASPNLQSMPSFFPLFISSLLL